MDAPGIGGRSSQELLFKPEIISLDGGAGGEVLLDGVKSSRISLTSGNTLGPGCQASLSLSFYKCSLGFQGL